MGYRKFKFIDRSNYKKHSLVALSIIWTGGIGIFIYLLFFFDKGDPANDNFRTAGIPAFHEINENTLNENSFNPVNDAYVFVNINKKHILTKFVSVMPETQAMSKTENDPLVTSVKKINKIIKTPHTNKSSDFSIKPTPEN